MKDPHAITQKMVFLDVNLTQLQTLCSSAVWQQHMMQKAPFVSREHFVKSANAAFDALSKKDWLEAFSGHPMIGNLDSLKKKYAHGATLSAKEQSGTSEATEQELRTLIDLNHQYLERFGFIFIVCATGRSAASMLLSLKQRLRRSSELELATAAEEQRKITLIRMDNLLLEIQSMEQCS
jgi:2-oxo-4-hydroxy-4-carboxy-5-ureidoimidazoline decarboxylase